MNANAMTAAHKTLPFGTVVKVIDQHSGRSVSVRINDRGPFVRGRIIDLSRAAAQHLGLHGTGKVCIQTT
jgi:rare lipoprotein A